MSQLRTLRFGVFPLGAAGTPDGVATGPADDCEQMAAALERLAGGGRPWLVRMYSGWMGAESARASLEHMDRWATGPWDLDMVLCYRDRTGDLDGWLAFVGEVIARWGDRFSTLQVTSEANLAGAPGAADGDYPRVAEALVRGVLRAAEAKSDLGAALGIGFAVAFEPYPERCFLWPEVRQLGGRDFPAAVDYAGIDMYPDVFPSRPPMTLEGLGEAVGLMLRAFRARVLEPIGIGPEVPVHICENGWPTGPTRSPQRQADAIESVVRAVHAARSDLNVTHWELFTLRDADSANDDLFYQFGILRDDYTPKPAFDRLIRLYGDLG
ncbi:MAG TPA: hypothetical protein VME46_20105 [Acidimicrobiales bacterium]|nr:hypothetical protein [Acidimicrobiales bacterium]